MEFKKTKVIYLISQPLDRRNWLRFGMEYWAEKSYEVVCIDLTYISYPKIYREFKARGGLIETRKIIYYSPEKMSDFIFIAWKFRKSNCKYYFDFLDFSVAEIIAKLYLGFLGLDKISYISGALPNPVGGSQSQNEYCDLNLTKIFRRIFKRNSFLTILNLILIRSLSFLNDKIFPAKIIFLSCLELNRRIGRNLTNKTVAYKIHALDYDLFINLKDPSLEVSQLSSIDYAVFLDEDMCRHTDYLYHHASAPTLPEKYYPSLRAFFNWFKKKYGMQIIIAAHPRARYSDAQKEFYFDNLEVMSDCTPNLVKHAKYVLCHSSTSISFGVLWAKPVTFLTSVDLENSIFSAYIKEFSRLLNGPIINLDDDSSCWQVKTELADEDRLRYSDYIDSYIKFPGSPKNSISWEIIEKKLSQNYLS